MKKFKAIVITAMIMASLYSCGINEENENTAVPGAAVNNSVTTADEVTGTSVTKISEPDTAEQESDNSKVPDSQSPKQKQTSQKNGYDSTYYTSYALSNTYHGGTPLDTEKELDFFTDENMKKMVTDWIRSVSENTENSVDTKVSCVNGYLCIDIVQYGESRNITDVKSAIFDLYSNTKLELEDIFYDVSEYRAHCSSIIKGYANRGERINEYGVRKPVTCKESFTVLDDSFSCITPLGIYVYRDNPFFEQEIKEDIYFENEEFFYNNSVIFSEARDMEGIFTDGTMISEGTIYENKDEFRYDYSGKTGNFDICQIIASCDKWSDEKIQKVNNLANVVMEDETIKSDLYKRCGKQADGPAMYDDSTGLFVGYSIEITGDTDANAAVVSITSLQTKNDGGHYTKLVYYFDADTLEPISNSEAIVRFLGSNWAENCECFYEGNYTSSDELINGIKDMVSSDFYSDFNSTQNKSYKSLYFDTLEGDINIITSFGGEYSVSNK